MKTDSNSISRAFNKALHLTDVPLPGSVHNVYAHHSNKVMATFLHLVECTERQRQFYMTNTKGSPTQRYAKFRDYMEMVG